MKGGECELEEDVTLDPIDVGFLGARGVMFGPNGVAGAIRQFLFTVSRHNLAI